MHSSQVNIIRGKSAVLICSLVLTLLASECQASTVSRAFSKNPAATGEIITVYLSVSVTGGETNYAIDETYPSGWAVTATSGNTSQLGHVKFAVSQGAANTNQTYDIRAPIQQGAYDFSGTYMFEGMAAESIISGQAQVNVIQDTSPPSITFVSPTPNNNTNVTASYIKVNASISETPGSCLLNWFNGTWTNISMTISGLSCYRNMTALTNYTYQFRVYATDLAGNLNVSSGTRQNNVQYSSPSTSCGDGSCNGAETCSSCPGDCGQCPCPSGQTRCSDGMCRADCGGGSGGGGSRGGGGAAPACIKDQTRSCSLNHKGKCGIGNETCLNGNWTGCQQPSKEVCNKIDDNCDGNADEGLTCECYAGQTRECGSNIGECRNGTKYCSNGNWGECLGEVKPSFDECNGKDDDCDGIVDNNCTSSFPWCRNGPIPESGCRCGEKVYVGGYCYSGIHTETSQEPDIPWIIYFMVFTALTALVIGALITYRVRKGRNMTVRWEDLKKDTSSLNLKFKYLLPQYFTMHSGTYTMTWKTGKSC